MAGERTLPGIGLTGYWDLGDNTYKAGMDINMRSLSALVQPFIDSIEATVPGAPTQGDIHIASGTWGGGTANDIMLYDNAGWIPITPGEGWKIYNRGNSKEMVFDGTNWIYPGDPRIVSSTSASYDLSESDLDGRTIIELSNSGTVTFTLTDGLVGLGPCTVINTGGGEIVFTEDTSSSLQSIETALKTQYAWATIIPRGSDVYHVGGNLEAAS